jgi:hypothetical protein
MKTITSKPKKKIKAEINNNFFGIVDRLFDNSPNTVFSEILQNSRRAGATLVKIETNILPDGSGLHVVIHDNGAGVSDMADLLRIRSSGWGEETMTREDPAGMGFFSLCRMRNLYVTSKDQVAFMGSNGEAFYGKTEVDVEQILGYIEGTQLAFDWPNVTVCDLRSALREVARYAPIDVMFDGIKIERASFKPSKCVDEFDTDDVTVYISRDAWATDIEFNFHGLVVTESGMLGISNYSACVDVKDTRNLQMVLPARNAIVHNKFYDDLVVSIRTRIYQIIANEGEHTLPYKNWKEACDLGVTMKPAVAALKDVSKNTARALQSTRTCVLMDSTNKRGCFQTVAAAMEKNGYYKLYDTDLRMVGYDWYDKLPLVTCVRYTQDDEQCTVQGAVQGVQTGSNLEVKVHLLDSEMSFPADILIGYTPYGHEMYNDAKSSAGGFIIDLSAKWSEEDIGELIDNAWQSSFMPDRLAKDWKCQRAMDVRKLLVGADRALDVVIKATVCDLLEAMSDLSTYAGTTVTLKCVVLPDGTCILE